MVAVAAVCVVVFVSISSGSSDPGGGSLGLQTGKPLAATIRAVNGLLRGIPQHGTALGRPAAPVTMTYYGDLECPICREFTVSVLPGFVAREVRTGEVRIQYRSLCTATCGPSLSPQAAQSLFAEQQVAAYAAGRQDRFWQYAELFYHQQGQEDSGYVTESYLEAIAREAGIRMGRWQSARADPTLADRVAGDQAAARSAGIDATPTLVLQGPRGRRVLTGVPAESSLVGAVQAVS